MDPDMALGLSGAVWGWASFWTQGAVQATYIGLLLTTSSIFLHSGQTLLLLFLSHLSTYMLIRVGPTRVSTRTSFER